MARLSENFLESEFKCKHTGIPTPCPPRAIDRGLINLLEALRCRLGGKPITVSFNGGYRCPIHNKNVGGATHSQHLYGKAADIKVAGVAPSVVQTEAEKLLVNTGGIGYGKTFTHLDTRAAKARWTY
jgi:uncharacterized protein YcbK (DUF882 family)